MFERKFQAGWNDIDFNGHVRNTAYLDYSSTTRMLYFQENGFPMSEFRRLNFGPVVVRDEIEYASEIHFLEEFTVKIQVAGFSPNYRRCRVRNVFAKMDGTLSASVTSLVVWLDLNERRTIIPPIELISALKFLEPTDDFQSIL